MFSTIKRDLIFALRQFLRNPGFAATAVLTLALGIGAATAIFTLVDGILLRPLPYPHPDQLVAINTLVLPPGAAANNPAEAVPDDTSYPDFFDWRRQNHTFASLASYQNTPRLFSKMNGEGARVMPAGRVSANLFSTLGVSPALGRNFLPEEEQAGHHAVILSHEIWISDFAASPAALGQAIKISDIPYVIVGVMPAGFHFPITEPASIWGAFSVDAEGPKPNIAQRGWGSISIIGRLKAGVMRRQGLAELNAIQRALAAQYPEDQARLGVAMTPMLEDAVADVRPLLTLLLAAVVLVLLIGCANVAGLLLARSNARLAEVALRSALGATRVQVIRQLLVESLLLALSGGAAGILLSFALLRAGMGLIPAGMPRAYDIGMDQRVLAFAILLSAITALIFGLLPAWRMSRVDPANALREGAASTTASRRSHRLHQTLVVAETALGFMLLIGAGLLIRTMMNVLAVDPGFDTKHTVAFDTALTNTRYPHDAKRIFLEKLLPQLAALPGVEKVSAAEPLPFHWPAQVNFSIVGHPVAPDRLPTAMNVVAEPGYFETLSIPRMRGRTFTVQDDSAQSPPVAVINQSFARRFFPGEDPIGKYLTTDVGQTVSKTIACQIVGIVGDTRTGDLSDPYPPQFFLPYAQDADHQRALVVLRVAGDPASYENAARQTVAGMDKDVPVFRYRTFAEDVQRQAVSQRFEAVLISSFAVLALLLAAVGLYAVLSYIVSSRTREYGLRIALGASRGDVTGLVLRRGLTLAMAGIVVGALASFFAVRLVSSLLFKVAPLDGLVFLGVTLLLIVVSTIATLVPALRAVSGDPMRALRDQ